MDEDIVVVKGKVLIGAEWRSSQLDLICLWLEDHSHQLCSYDEHDNLLMGDHQSDTTTLEPCSSSVEFVTPPARP